MERLQSSLPFCGCRRLPDGPGQQRSPGEIGTITDSVDNFPVEFFFPDYLISMNNFPVESENFRVFFSDSLIGMSMT